MNVSERTHPECSSLLPHFLLGPHDICAHAHQFVLKYGYIFICYISPIIISIFIGNRGLRVP